MLLLLLLFIITGYGYTILLSLTIIKTIFMLNGKFADEENTLWTTQTYTM